MFRDPLHPSQATRRPIPAARRRDPLRADGGDRSRQPEPRRATVRRMPVRRSGHMPRLALAALGVVAVAAPAVALANDAAFRAVVPFSGGRHTDLRAGEPLEFFYTHEKIAKVCWSPAPIQHAACGNGFAAAAQPGRQKITLTLKGGAVKHETLTIGAPATHVASFAEAGSASARVVEFEATCDTTGYDAYTGGKLRGASDAAKIEKGDRVGAFYRTGHALLAMPYATGQARFYNVHCLEQVHH